MFVSIIFLKLVIGCNAGDCLTCTNGGECLSNGTCSCKLGFSGKQCQDCKSFFFDYFLEN